MVHKKMIKTSPCLQGHALYEKSVSHLCLTLWTHGLVAHQAPLSVGFPRQEYWSRLPFPSPGDLSNPGIEPRSPALQADSLPSELPVKPTTFSLLSVTAPLSWIFIIMKTSLSNYLSETWIFTQHCFLAMSCRGFGIQRRWKNKSSYPQRPASYFGEKSSDSTVTFSQKKK